MLLFVGEGGREGGRGRHGHIREECGGGSDHTYEGGNEGRANTYVGEQFTHSTNQRTEHGSVESTVAQSVS